MRQGILFSIAIAFAAHSAFAVDGVVLINQSTVMAAGGFPYTISQPGSYKLSGNLTVTTIKDAIVIQHDDVTLDLNGFAIVGPGTYVAVGVSGCTPGGDPAHCAGISSFGYQNITIKNGVIRGFSDGVYVGGTALISDLQTSRNLVGVSASGSIILVRCAANNNDFWGINVGNATVSECTANNNTVDGIEASGSTLIHNVASQNGGYGINTFNFGRSVAGSNTLLNNRMGSLNLVGSGSISQGNNVCDAGAC